MAGSACAQTVGTTTADILKINQGTRPSAMGGVFTAMGDDVYSMSYNPAGLSYIKATQVVLLHLDSLADIQYEYLALGTAFGSGDVLGLNLTYRHSPTIDNNNGNPPVNTDDLLGGLSCALKLMPDLRAGLSIKYLKSTLANYSGTAIAFDLGAVLDHLPYGCKVGAAVQNLGTGMTFTPGGTGAGSGYPSENLPMFLRLGIGTHQVFDGNKDFNAAVEVFKPADQDIKLGVGAEFWLFPQLFAVRGGYKFENLGNLFGGTDPNTGNAFPGVPNTFDNYSLGCTLTRRIDGDDFSVDIAYNPANFTSTTSDTFFFALNLKFNQFRIF
ncbi:MAG TPA: PorV/PorQ family protein [bacterium]|nr:PorV/PorQ family protein [bacterium]